MTDPKDKPQDKPKENTDAPDVDAVVEPADASPDPGENVENVGPTEAVADAEAPASAEASEPSPPQQQESSQTQPREKKPVVKNGSRHGFFSALVFLLLIGAIAVLGYFGWEREQALQTRIDQLDAGLSDQRSQISGAQRQVQSAAAELQSSAQQSRQQLGQMQEQLQSRLNEQRKDLETQLQTLHQQLRALGTTTTEDWKLAEAYYLMRLATQRLLMERDTSSALALLETADGIVRNYPDADLHAVRSALADDMATLRLTDNVDLQGIYLRIAALGRQAQSLPIAEGPTFAPASTDAEAVPIEEEEESQDIGTSIRGSFQAMVDRLSDYIRISHDQDELDSLLGPAAADQLLSSLLVNLDTAQLALLREQAEIYQHSLDRALQLTLRLVREGQQRQRFATELEALRETDIIQDLPSIGASQQAMAVYLERRHRLAPRGPGNGNGNGNTNGSVNENVNESANGNGQQSGSSQP